MLAGVVALTFGCSSTHTASVHGGGRFESHAGSRQPSPVAIHREDELTAHNRRRIGRSVNGHTLWAYHLGDPDSPRPILVVGCIHGDEPAGVAVAHLVIRYSHAGEANVWVVPDMNPDGVLAGTRQNADGVDLNRNFPYRWRPLGIQGTPFYAGSRPLSEPESRAIAGLIQRIQPRVSIWFHQPYGVVDESGGSIPMERRFARLIDLPLERLPRYPGSVSTWQNHRFPGSTAFVVELPGRPLTRAIAHRYADAVTDFAG